jgi:hypothetical protein
MHQSFQNQKYLVRKKFFKLLGEEFQIFNETGSLLLYAKLKPFAWKEEIRLYTDETKSTELLLIKARRAIDFSAVYDIFDSQTNERIGALKRHGLRSMLQDEWWFLDLQEQQVGYIKEDNQLLAIIRRFLTNLIPQEFEGFIGENKVLHFKQNFNPFISKIELDFSMDSQNLLDRRLGIAAGILLNAIEGKQN